MNDEQLKLDNQLCFPFYAASRLITKLYQPMLAKLGITYPQYLALMVLWETDNVSVKAISEKLILESNTLTPLLKRMEASELIQRKRSENDERVVMISLTQKGHDLKEQALEIPEKLLLSINSDEIDLERLSYFKKELSALLRTLTKV